MTKDLSKGIVAHSLQVMQSAIEKNLNELLTSESVNTQNIEFIYSEYSKKDAALKIERYSYSQKQSTPLPTYVIYSLENMEIWFSFPKQGVCKWVNIYFNTPEEMQTYIDYLNNQYKYLGKGRWYNKESNILFHIFYIEQENHYTIVAMKKNKNVRVIETLFEWSM